MLVSQLKEEIEKIWGMWSKSSHVIFWDGDEQEYGRQMICTIK